MDYEKVWDGSLGEKYINLNNEVFQYAKSNFIDEYEFYAKPWGFLFSYSLHIKEDKEVLEKVIEVSTDGIKNSNFKYLLYNLRQWLKPI